MLCHEEKLYSQVLLLLWWKKPTCVVEDCSRHREAKLTLPCAPRAGTM